jgi:hypothetical protein
MALTMTRTRTQTALTRLVKALAGINGELAHLEGVLGKYPVGSEQRSALELRRERVAADREALCATIRQFDPTLDPGEIGMPKPKHCLHKRRSASSP